MVVRVRVLTIGRSWDGCTGHKLCLLVTISQDYGCRGRMGGYGLPRFRTTITQLINSPVNTLAPNSRKTCGSACVDHHHRCQRLLAFNLPPAADLVGLDVGQQISAMAALADTILGTVVGCPAQVPARLTIQLDTIGRIPPKAERDAMQIDHDGPFVARWLLLGCFRLAAHGPCLPCLARVVHEDGLGCQTCGVSGLVVALTLGSRPHQPIRL